MQKLDKVMSYLLEQMPPPDTLRTTIANLKNDIAIWEEKLKNGTDKEKQLARLILPDKREQLRRSLMVARDQKQGKLKKYPQTQFQYVPPRPGTPPTPKDSPHSSPPPSPKTEAEDTEEDTQGEGTQEEEDEEEVDIFEEYETNLPFFGDTATPEPGPSREPPIADRTRSKKPKVTTTEDEFSF